MRQWFLRIDLQFLQSVSFLQPMMMRITLNLLLLLLSVTAVTASQSPTGTLQLKLRTANGQPLEKTTVRVRFDIVSPLRYPFETPLLTDSTGVAVIKNVPEGSCRINLEIMGFDYYSLEVSIKAGETTTVEAQLEPVEELTLIRLPDEPFHKLIRACEQSKYRQVEFKRTNFDNEQQWAALWSDFKLAAPPVDFKQWQVLAWLGRAGDSSVTTKIRRVTYNAKQKIIRVRLLSPEKTADLRIPVITCVADFALFLTFNY